MERTWEGSNGQGTMEISDLSLMCHPGAMRIMYLFSSENRLVWTENASVVENTLFRFRWDENGCIQKQINVVWDHFLTTLIDKLLLAFHLCHDQTNLARALSAVQTNLTSGWLWNEKLFPLFTVFNILNTPTNLPLFFLLIVCLSTLRRLEQSEITSSSLFLSYYARCDWVVSLLYGPPKFLVMYRHVLVTLMANKRVRRLKTLTTRLKCANNWQLQQTFRTGSIFFSPTPVIWRSSAWLEMVCWQ